MNKNIKIKFGFKYYVSYLFLGLLSILLTIICSFLFKNDEIIYKILFYVLMYLCIFVSIFGILYYYQYVIIKDDEIIFKSLLCTFEKIKLNEIKRIKKESLVTFTNSLGFKSSNDWIVFYTDESQIAKHGLNKRKRPPYMMPYNEQNATIIKTLLRNNVNIEL